MNKTQLEHNSKIEGGFIGAILPMLGELLLSNVLPTLATGALLGVGQAVGSTAVNKVAGGKVMYLKKNGMACKMRAAGEGLYLAPWRKGSSLGEGLFLKSGTGYIEGRGMFFGPNSPFKDVLILGMIL